MPTATALTPPFFRARPLPPEAHRLLAAGVLFALLLPQAPAQVTAGPTASAAPAANAVTDEVVVLDPFVISAAEDHDSYEATATMAATRIRTELRDVGSAISVVTSQFLRDTNSRNSQDLLVFTTNTEVGGPRGNFSGLDPDSLDDLGARLAPQTNTRIRGLTAADNTRDFFLTDIPWDSFNTGRIDIQRGPNAILFGLGSPAGIVNASTNIASFKDEGGVEFRFGSQGSHRATLDVNSVLRPDELALRLDLLDDRTDFRQRPAFNRDRRWYGALRWDPKLRQSGGGHTSFRASFEHGAIEANRPHIVPPGDLITPWFTALHKMGVDPATWQNDPQVNQLVAAGEVGSVLAVFADPSSGANTFITGGAPGSVLGMVERPVDYLPKSYSPAEAFKVYRGTVLQDRSIFDYVNHLIDGPNKREWSGHDILNLTLAQTFLHDRLGLEAAYDHQRNASFAVTPDGEAALSVDINTRLPDGRPNANFGRPYLQGDVFANAYAGSTRDAWRLTGFGELKFADFWKDSPLVRLLGRHVFTGFWSRERSDLENFDWRAQVADAAFAPHTGGYTIDSWRITPLSYLGPSLAGRDSAAGAHVSGLQAVQHVGPGEIDYLDALTGTWTNLPLSVVGNYTGARFNGNHAHLTRDDVVSHGVVWQGFFWDGLVVPLVGLRRDRDRSYAMTNAPVNPDGSIDFASPDYRLPAAPNNSVSGDSTTWSVVVHSPRFLREKFPGQADFSAFYNRSENFQPAAGRIDVRGNPLPPPAGRTRDYGFRASLLDDRVNLKVNWYRTEVTNDALPLFGGLFALPNAEAWGYMYARQTLANNGDGYGGYAGGYLPVGGQTAAQAKADGIAIASAFLDPKNQPPDSFYSLYHIDRSGWQGFITGGPPPGLTITGDTLARGTEYEITAAPWRNWNISFNAAKGSAEEHHLARSLASWIEQRWLVFNTPVAGTSQPAVIGDVRLFGPGPYVTVRDLYRDNLWVPYLIYKLKDGASVSELRPWRFNFVTTYTFSRGSLKDVKVGGAYRWQDREVIGYPVFPDASASSPAAFDLVHPYLGPSERNIDFWIGYERKLERNYLWRVQLNVSNAFARKELIPISVQPDGTLAAGRIPEGTVWTVTNSISF
jgi:outer membrane receptor protein involved in Fe transport